MRKTVKTKNTLTLLLCRSGLLRSAWINRQILAVSGFEQIHDDKRQAEIIVADDDFTRGILRENALGVSLKGLLLLAFFGFMTKISAMRPWSNLIRLAASKPVDGPETSVQAKARTVCRPPACPVCFLSGLRRCIRGGLPPVANGGHPVVNLFFELGQIFRQAVDGLKRRGHCWKSGRKTLSSDWRTASPTPAALVSLRRPALNSFRAIS